MCFAVPPRFAVSSRKAAFAGADKAETGLAYRYPAFDNGRNPGASLLKQIARSGGGCLRVFAVVPGCLAPSGSSLAGRWGGSTRLSVTSSQS